MSCISKEITNHQEFLDCLFDSFSTGLVIIDDQHRVMALNYKLEQTLGMSSPNSTDMDICSFLGCRNIKQTTPKFGSSGKCLDCGIQHAATEALSGKPSSSMEMEYDIRLDKKIRKLRSTINASPLLYRGKRLAIISIGKTIIEDFPETNRMESDAFPDILTRNKGMREIFEIMKRVSEVNVPVLIQGESGTGKELVANAIHENSKRSQRPFVAVNCAALPEGILESELFGHMKGAFTGALKDKIGRFEMAHKGTLFLDEVADLPKMVQAKLLRVLQEGTFERVGGEKSISVDMRIISATNHNLKNEVTKGNFREDLFYRLNVVPITLPPLRKRKEDISLLAEQFVSKTNGFQDETRVISKDVHDILKQYHWPGNVRELQSAIRFALVKSKGAKIHKNHLPVELRECAGNSPARGPSRKLDNKSVSNALAKCGGNKAKAARSLGVGRATLYRFMDNVLNGA